MKGEYIPDRTPEKAIKEKLQVLRDFDIVNDDNEECFRSEMDRALAARPDTHFDRILDRFAANLYRQKFA